MITEYWGDGRARLWNPPFDLLSLVVSKIERDGGNGLVVAPYWPAQSWFAHLSRLAHKMTVLEEPAHLLFEGRKRVNPGWGMVVAEISAAHGGQRSETA